MDNPVAIKLAGTLAASYNERMTNMIQKMSDWWFHVEGQIDEQFGVAVHDSLSAAQRVLESLETNEELLLTSTWDFSEKLQVAFSASEQLVQHYDRQAQKSDLKIQMLFHNIIKEHISKLEKESEISPPESIEINELRRNLEGNKKDNTVQNKNQFWLLRLNGQNWQVSALKEGDELYFNTHRPGIGPAGDYDLFTNVKPNDEGLAYEYGRTKAIVFKFRITKGLHLDPHQGEIITFQIEHIPVVPIPLAFLSNKIEFVRALEGNEPIKLFKLTAEEFSNILSDVPPQTVSFKRYFTEPSIADIFTDVSTPNLKDHLDFENDYTALASLIAYRHFQPPLAIGLFGNWGSGKSFFMNKLQEQIETFARSTDESFCHKIVQINFNSWHYSDSNLWASLITKIFEDLEKAGSSEGDKTRVELLFKNLNSFKELQVECEQQLLRVDNELSELNEQERKVDQEIKDKTKHLKGMNFIDLAKDIFETREVKDDIEEIKNKFNFVKTKDLKELNSSLTELQTNTGKAVESIKILYSFRSGNLWIALLVAAIVFFASSWLLTHVSSLKAIFGEMKLLIAPSLVLVSQLIVYLNRAAPTIDQLYSRLVSLKQKTAELELKAQNTFNVEREEIENKIKSAQLLQNSLQEKIKALELKKAEAQYEIDNIASGKKLVGFIEGRVSDQRYTNSLGIISWIRKDFEQLDFLLKQQYDAQKLKELNKEAIENIFEVNRIILYIDDLDRCDVSVVVRVLEAIHLLLAFPLFVVVVGVDPRWMHNALHIKYKGFISKEASEGNTSELRSVRANNNNDDEHDILVHGQPATSFDYLEKIFQIPFVIRPIDPKGKKRFIEANLRGDYYERSDNPTNKVSVEVGGEQIAVRSADRDTTTMSLDTDGSATKSGSSHKQTSIGGHSKIHQKEQVEGSSNSLQIPEEEITFMQALQFLVGESPRTIKRYINIYRIIRAHAGFTFIDGNKAEHYYAAMIILGIVTTFPENAKDFLNYLKGEANVTPFFRSYQNYLKEKGSDKPFPVSLINEIEDAELVKTIRSITMDKFKINLDLICRFSFRNIMDV